MSTGTTDPSKPDWLLEENDERIVDELLVPLFGTGNVSLQDDDTDIQQSTNNNNIRKEMIANTNHDIEHGNNINNYGSIAALPSKNLEQHPIDTKRSIERGGVPSETISNKHKPPTTTTKSITSEVTAKNKYSKTTQQRQNNNHDETNDEMIYIMKMKPHRPQYNICLYIFHLLEGITITAAICLLCTQLIPFIMMMIISQQATNTTSQNNNNNSHNILSSSSASNNTTITNNILLLLLHIYMIFFCILFILTEYNSRIIVQYVPILQRYMSRGFIYSFCGLICTQEAYSERIQDILYHTKNISTSSSVISYMSWTSIFMEVSSWVMLCIGIIYMILGLCCCKRIRDHYKQKEIDAWDTYKREIQEWKQQYTTTTNTTKSK